MKKLHTLKNKILRVEINNYQKQKGVDWQFTSEDVRGKLKYLYPLLNF